MNKQVKYTSDQCFEDFRTGYKCIVRAVKGWERLGLFDKYQRELAALYWFFDLAVRVEQIFVEQVYGDVKPPDNK